MNTIKTLIAATALTIAWAWCWELWVWKGTPEQQEEVLNERALFQNERNTFNKNLSENRLMYAPILLDEWIEVTWTWKTDTFYITLSGHTSLLKIVAKTYASWKIWYSYQVGPAVSIEWIKQEGCWFVNDLATDQYSKWYQLLTEIFQKYNKKH